MMKLKQNFVHGYNDEEHLEKKSHAIDELDSYTQDTWHCYAW